MVNSSCDVDLKYFVYSTQIATEWALQMIDSSSKYPSSIMRGGVDLGNFEECLSVSNDRFIGKYCTLEGSADFVNETHAMQRILNLRKSLIWGQCIPSSCTEDDLAHHKEYISFPYKYFSKIQVSACYSRSDEEFTFPFATKIILSFLILWIGAILLMTVLNSKRFEKNYVALKFGTVCKAVSLTNNWSSLCYVSTKDNILACLHGLRLVSTFFVILCHQMVREMLTPYKNSDDVRPMITASIPSMLLANSIIAVDSFMLMGGLLSSYNFMNDREKQNKTNPVSYFIHRYIRLTPIYAIAIFFSAELWIHTGTGPLWKSSVQGLVDSCQQSWFYNLLYVSNYFNSKPNEMCLPHTWYLSADMHLYCIGTLLLMVMYKKPMLGKLLMLSLSTISITLTYYFTVRNHYPWTYTFGLQDVEHGRNYFSEVYVKTHTRAAPYIIGLWLGDILYRRKDKKLNISQVWIWLISLLTALIAAFIVFSLYYYYNNEYSAIIAGIYAAFHRPVWALCMSWLIFVCANGYGGIVNRFLSQNSFQVFSKLSYCIYLIHYMIIIQELATTKAAFIFSFTNMMFKLIKNIIITIILSTLTTLFFEMPVVQLNKIYIRR